AKPNMRRSLRISVALLQEIPHQRGPLRQDLEGVPVGFLHRVEHAPDEFLWHSLMEKVAHRIHEYHSRSSPFQRLLQASRSECKVEAVLEGMVWRAAEALREALGIAVVTARADLRATRHRIPRRVRPLDGRAVSHAANLSRQESCLKGKTAF